MNVMKSGLVSALLLCTCVLVSISATKHHHGNHHHKKSSTTKHVSQVEHHHSNHKKSGTVVRKAAENVKTQHEDSSKKSSVHHHSNHKKSIIAKHVVGHGNHDYKKSDIMKYDQLSKKFDITAHPQKRPDMMTVVMKGANGQTGLPGAEGDMGSPGPVGPAGETGDKGLPGVCSRTQCENEQLKSLIQRLLALEKFVNIGLKNKKNTTTNKTTSGNIKKACNPIVIAKTPGLLPCPSPLLAIVPLFRFTKPSLVPGVTPQGKPPAQSPKPTQSQPKPKGTASPLSGTPTSAILAKPSSSGTAVPARIAGPQRPAATPPPSPFYITLQGVTSYDSPLAIQPQQQTISYLKPQYNALPANWVTSGSGPIDLKQAAKTPSRQALYSPNWSYSSKREKIPHHDLLTHKLAHKMLKTSTKKSTTKSTKDSGHHNTKETTSQHHVTKTAKE